MSIRDLALGALADKERADQAAAEAAVAARHAAAASATREFFARLGVSDVVVDGATFVLPDEDFHGRVTKGGASVFWYTSPIVSGRGNTYNHAEFTDLTSLGRALRAIDAARAAGRFYQDQPKRS
jgi:hypothetical protein